VTEPLRLAGRGRLLDGGLVTWSLAEGIRGRRWRATLGDGGRLRAALLLEVAVDGRPMKLELATPVGLLTVHPEPDGVLHGNVVTAAGVGPIDVPFGGALALDVERLPIGAAVACHGLAGSVGVGEGIELPVVRLGHDLSVRSSVARVGRRAPGAWTIDGAPLDLDARGVVVLGEAHEWPLETAGEGVDPVR
jgi:hypothetical protein